MGQVLSYIWRCVRPRPKLEDDQRRIPHNNDQSNPFEEDSHYIAIPDTDTTRGIVSRLNPDVTSNSQKRVCTPREHFFVVDLSNVDEKFDSAELEEEESQEITQVIVKKEVIAEVLVTPSELTYVSRETVQKTHVPRKTVQKIHVPRETVQKTHVPRETVQKTHVPRETVQKIGPYTSKQKILLVGEGDFSFSASLAVAFGCASNMIATSLNSQEFLAKNYSMFRENKMALEVRGCMVIHGVDARNMINHDVLGSLRFDRIIFNFPHAGCFRRTDHDIRKNRELIKGFLRCAKKMVNREGEIHITHKSNGFFRQWNIPKLGLDQGLELIREIKFKRSIYAGYHTKFGFGGNKDFDCNPSKTYMFGIHPT
ncbi:hypothetical protein RND81_12G188700 [Saponaria officinalis]|uniref:25S rRNA (uridine-N(3))-methyltransferase BMT5-like domain-containing protein n=1 Tax=Saponaria officinalis TaxID=3572 RepID=A0AAW1HCH6_SAPOF